MKHIFIITKFVSKPCEQISCKVQNTHMSEYNTSRMQIGLQRKMQQSLFIYQLASEKYTEQRIRAIINCAII